MKRLLKDGGYFLALYALFFVALLAVIIAYQKKDLHLFLTSVNNIYSDVFFNYATRIGGGLSYFVAVALLFYKIRSGLYVLVVQLVTLLLTNSLKLIFGTPRPKAFFEENFPDVILHQVDGIRLYLSNGFPSGHTSSAFALMFCLALIFRNKWLSVFCFLIALLVGYSRIYLSQHFAEDVLFGSFIGVVVAALFYHLYLRMSAKYKWANEPLVHFSQKRN